MGENEEEIREQIRRAGVEIYEKNERILLIRKFFPCPHKHENGESSRHLHYYVTSKKRYPTLSELKELIDWLDWGGFWWDAGIEGGNVKPILERFQKGQCMGNAHFL